MEVGRWDWGLVLDGRGRVVEPMRKGWRQGLVLEPFPWTEEYHRISGNAVKIGERVPTGSSKEPAQEVPAIADQADIGSQVSDILGYPSVWSF